METVFSRRWFSALEALLADLDQWDDENIAGEDEEEAEVVEKLAGNAEIDDVNEFLDALRGDDDRVIEDADAHKPVSERLSLHTPQQYIRSSCLPGLLRACTASSGTAP